MDTTVKLTVKLPEGLRRRAKAAAAIRGETVSAVVREALEDYISEVLEGNGVAQPTEPGEPAETDPMLEIIGQFDSGRGDLAEHHDEYLVDLAREENR